MARESELGNRLALLVRFTVLGESKAAGDAECKSIDTFGLNIVPCIRFGKPVVDVLCQLMRQSFDFFYDYQHEDRVLKKLWEKFYLMCNVPTMFRKVTFLFAASQ